MEPPAVTVFPTLEAFHRGAAEHIGEIIRRVLSRRAVCSVALAGGSTPGPVYELLAEASFDWSAVDVFFTDERAVPPDHPESNYRMVRSALLDRVTIPPTRVHRIRGEWPPEEAARAYEAELPPSLDLVVLGMGADGHTASLFPGIDAAQERHALVRAVRAPHLHPDRVTLTLAALNAARQVLFLASGPGKAEAVSAVLEGRDPHLPATHVCPKSGEVLWFLDEAAARCVTP
jgi:6-phosphogluconolactonase